MVIPSLSECQLVPVATNQGIQSRSISEKCLYTCVYSTSKMLSSRPETQIFILFSASHFLLLLLLLRDFVISIFALVLATVHVLSKLVLSIHCHVTYAAVVTPTRSTEVGVVPPSFPGLLGLNGHHIVLLSR